MTTSHISKGHAAGFMSCAMTSADKRAFEDRRRQQNRESQRRRRQKQKTMELPPLTDKVCPEASLMRAQQSIMRNQRITAPILDNNSTPIPTSISYNQNPVQEVLPNIWSVTLGPPLTDLETMWDDRALDGPVDPYYGHVEKNLAHVDGSNTLSLYQARDQFSRLVVHENTPGMTQVSPDHPKNHQNLSITAGTSLNGQVMTSCKVETGVDEIVGDAEPGYVAEKSIKEVRTMYVLGTKVGFLRHNDAFEEYLDYMKRKYKKIRLIGDEE